MNISSESEHYTYSLINTCFKIQSLRNLSIFIFPTVMNIVQFSVIGTAHYFVQIFCASCVFFAPRHDLSVAHIM